MRSADLIKEIKAAGWVLKRVNGSHHNFRHPDYSHVLTIPHPKKELQKGLVAKIRKDAGL